MLVEDIDPRRMEDLENCIYDEILWCIYHANRRLRATARPGRVNAGMEPGFDGLPAVDYEWIWIAKEGELLEETSKGGGYWAPNI